MSTLGEKIKKRRLQLKWSLDNLAQKSKVSKAYLSQLETGDSDRPSAEVLYNIAVVLDVSIAELLGKKLTRIAEERDEDIPEGLKKAAIEHRWSQDDIKMLLGVAFRAKQENKKLKPEDWLHIYETITREIYR